MQLRKGESNQVKYSSREMSSELVSEIKNALASVGRYGSVEVYVSGGTVTQITVRSIKKTNGFENGKSDSRSLGL